MTESWGVVFLGVIALSSLVQAGFLIGLAVAGRRLARGSTRCRTGSTARSVRRWTTSPASAANFAEVTDLVTLQARRIDDLLADTIEKIEDATNMIRRVVVRPLGPLVDLTAFLKGIRRGVEVYYKLRGLESRHRPPPRRVADEDEHLFI